MHDEMGCTDSCVEDDIDKIPARLQLKIEHTSWRQLTRSLDSGPPVETRILFKPPRTLSGKPLLGKNLTYIHISLDHLRTSENTLASNLQ